MKFLCRVRFVLKDRQKFEAFSQKLHMFNFGLLNICPIAVVQVCCSRNFFVNSDCLMFRQPTTPCYLKFSPVHRNEILAILWLLRALPENWRAKVRPIMTRDNALGMIYSRKLRRSEQRRRISRKRRFVLYLRRTTRFVPLVGRLGTASKNLGPWHFARLPTPRKYTFAT
jgi:hypothetical protein